MDMVKTILVSDATGTVGSEVVKQLCQLNNNFNIRAAIHSHNNKVDNLKRIIDNYDRIKLVNFDYNEPSSVQKTFDEVDKIFILTIPSPNSSDVVSNLVKEAKKKMSNT